MKPNAIAMLIMVRSLAAVVFLIAAPAHAEELKPNRWEPGALPAIAFDSDLGFGFGLIGALARYEEGYSPYRFRILAQAFMTATTDDVGDVIFPFQDHYIAIDMPGLADDAVRLNAWIAFGRYSNSGYYGLGNLAAYDPDATTRFNTYDRIFPSADANFRVKIYANDWMRFELFVGGYAAYNWMKVHSGSKLDRDLKEPDLDDLLHGTEDHFAASGKAGVLLDTRDHEYAPTRGTFTEIALRPSAEYASYYIGSSWFAPLIGEHVVLATRINGDIIVGDAPIYELRTFGVLTRKDGPGGHASVRGLLLHRYHGKVKLIGNTELRGNFPWFDVWGERLRFGLVAFADAGRVWTDLEPRKVRGEELDGPWSPFKVGTGGGLRFQWGETFIVRADFGYSPTDETTGFYVDVGHVF